ncbi:hypothetical protein HOY82DRAFT_588469 [Tuber indicum]|nr:hypothetical protein HOY82DRAFT_588469 [Tuber indicum]
MDPSPQHVSNKRSTPARTTGSKKKLKSSQSPVWTLPAFFDRHPREWTMMAYLEQGNHRDIPASQMLDVWIKSLEFIVDPENGESGLRLTRASELLSECDQEVEGSSGFMDRQPAKKSGPKQTIKMIGAGIDSKPTRPARSTESSKNLRHTAAFNSYTQVDHDRGTRPGGSLDGHGMGAIAPPGRARGTSLPASWLAAYRQMNNEHKWELTSGRRVEDVIYEACIVMDLSTFASSPAQLFIIDTSNAAVQAWFTDDEWDEIMAALCSVPGFDQELLDSCKRLYSVETTIMLRKVAKSDLVPGDGTYDPNIHYNLQWAQIAILKFIMLLEAPNYCLTQPHLEGRYGVIIWSDILDACFLDVDSLTVDRMEGTCRATIERRNHDEVVLTESPKRGPWVDGTIRTTPANYYEYGAIKERSSLTSERDSFDLLRSLRDMLTRLDVLANGEPNIRAQMQVVGISTARLGMQYARLGHPGVGYVRLLENGPIINYPTTLDELPDLLSMLVMVAQLKQLIRVSVEAVQDRELLDWGKPNVGTSQPMMGLGVRIYSGNPFAPSAMFISTDTEQRSTYAYSIICCTCKVPNLLRASLIRKKNNAPNHTTKSYMWGRWTGDCRKEGNR